MANNVLNWVWQHSRSKHGSRLVLLALADRARENGIAWPSVADLKQMTGLGDRAVQAAIIDCSKLGELEVGYQQGPKGCNRYRLLMPPTPADIAPPQSLRGADSAGAQELRGSESPQVDSQDPAISAPPADIAPPQISTPTPANFAGGTLIEPPQNSPTESSEGGAGGDALFDAESKPPARARRKSPKPAAGPAFERWYAAYPVHKARGEAEKAWLQVTGEGADPEVLTAAAERYRSDPQVLRGWGKHPATWLRAECWLDEAAPDGPPPSPNGHQPSTTDQRVAQAQALKQKFRQQADPDQPQLPPGTIPGEVMK